MAAGKGLGKGFDVLVPNTFSVQEVTSRSEDKIHKLALDVVKPRDDQPRKAFDNMQLEQLAHSIRQHGVMQPIVVVRSGQNMYSIIAGERRWRAAHAAGLSEIPAIIRTLEELQILELSLIENVQRADLSPLEVALAIDRLHAEFGQSYEQIAHQLGKAYVTIMNTQRLLHLPDNIQESLRQSRITEGHARALLMLKKYPVQQQELFDAIVVKHLSVRQAESLAAKYKSLAARELAQKPVSPKADAAHDEHVSKLGMYLHAPVAVHHTAKGGRLTIRFRSPEELEQIISKIVQE